MWSGSHPPAARNSPCCPPTMPTATSPRWCSAFRSASRSSPGSHRSGSCGPACPWSPPFMSGRQPMPAAERPPVAASGVVAVLLGCFIAGFHTRLFGIGLPDLRGAMGLEPDQGAWLSTVALGQQILVAPTITWLVTAFGLRRVLVGPALAYALLSLLIPMVRDYPTLLVLHGLHGA